MAGGGVVGIWCAPIQGSCDHNRASNCPELKGKDSPIWDFLRLLADGSMYRLHPRWRGTKPDWGPYYPDQALHKLVPAKGIGLSDGPGTCGRGA